ncbi:hypothetical protein [Endozoicomonas sp. SESOKO1]|uniref:hypothetical protein n=1 Tax=Endozoicomonas sp. SESOKO1 TaxID=2828742 RepID=UPI00214768AF|nr:hypothetical protein [Endozoicomonas sp. SESOKO1]
MKKFNYRLAQKRVLLAISILKLVQTGAECYSELLPLLSMAFNYSNRFGDYAFTPKMVQ